MDKFIKISQDTLQKEAQKRLSKYGDHIPGIIHSEMSLTYSGLMQEWEWARLTKQVSKMLLSDAGNEITDIVLAVGRPVLVTTAFLLDPIPEYQVVKAKIVIGFLNQPTRLQREFELKLRPGGRLYWVCVECGFHNILEEERLCRRCYNVRRTTMLNEEIWLRNEDWLKRLDPAFSAQA